MKIRLQIMVSLLAVCSTAFAGPYAPPAGQSGSTAIYKDDAAFVAWADDYQDYIFGTNVDAIWRTPENALGKAQGVVGSGDGAVHNIVSLGDFGEITLTFSRPIADGDGADFAVFENSLNDMFLELAWVEVSSDGVNFFRFSNDSLTAGAVGAYGVVDATDINGLAGKYRQSYGTPFDLAELEGIEGLNIHGILYVRIVDVVGDGTCLDSSGDPIYDPYPTWGSGGFDLDAVGVINQALTGDANLDGVVDVLDLDALAYHWGQTRGASWTDGDFNDDGVIDVLDLDLLAGNWGAGAASFAEALSLYGLPEPATLALLAAGLPVILKRRNKVTK